MLSSLPMPSLFVVRGRDQGKHFQLNRPVIRIGRESSNDIQLFDSEASRSHAEIRLERNGVFELADLGSSNGTRINGQRAVRQYLRSGDRIEIGNTLMIFTGTGQPSVTESGATESGVNEAGALESTHGIDVVLRSSDYDGSRIVAKLSQSGSDSKVVSGTVAKSDSDRSLEVMYLTALAVGRTDDLDEVLRRVLQLVFDWVEADRGCVMLRDHQTGALQPATRCDRKGINQLQSERSIAISHTILDYVMEHKEGVRTSNAVDDSRFDAAASIVQGGVREALCVPLQGRYEIVGALYVDTYTPPGELIASGHHQRFTDDHLRLITAIGHQAALAIEDTFYYSALVQSERLAAMGQTIATLSHHVKNILQGIRGGSYLIESGLDRNDTQAVRRGWSIVDRNQERISHLVMDMLTFSKEREPERVEADLNDTVAEVVDLMQSRAQELNVTLERQLDPGLPTASFDPDGIHRALLNLVTNALDAAAGKLSGDGDLEMESEAVVPRPPGHVLVRSCYDPVEGWMIDVIDNGPGIAPEDRQKIFSLFESRKGMRGTGLGLPVSAKILREHGGDVLALDTAEGTGTCFRMYLPSKGTNLSELSQRDTMG